MISTGRIARKSDQELVFAEDGVDDSRAKTWAISYQAKSRPSLPLDDRLSNRSSQPGMLRGSLPGSMVSFARMAPSRPWMFSSPPPAFPTI